MENTKELRYLIRIGAETTGPYSVAALETLALNGTISPATLVAREGSPEFRTLHTWAFFKQVFPSGTLEMAKEPSSFVKINPAPHPEPNQHDWTLRISSNLAHGGHGEQKDNANSSSIKRERAIDSLKEWEARIAADPYDPVVISSMNVISLWMQRDGMTRKRALRRLFAANREVNRGSDRRAESANIDGPAAQLRITAIKYAIVLAAVCGGVIYLYPGARNNGQAALESIGVIYGVCFIAARWIVRMNRSVSYLLTALQLYVFGWSIWVIISLFRDARVQDPFEALFNCLVHWHLG